MLVAEDIAFKTTSNKQKQVGIVSTDRTERSNEGKGLREDKSMYYTTQEEMIKCSWERCRSYEATVGVLWSKTSCDDFLLFFEQFCRLQRQRYILVN